MTTAVVRIGSKYFLHLENIGTGEDERDGVAAVAKDFHCHGIGGRDVQQQALGECSSQDKHGIWNYLWFAGLPTPLMSIERS